ncbi:MAG: hypothetical protein ACXAEU_03550 [Candidatus Hodarchaeales archaeon]|jgi:hypothetical protein
MAEEVDTGKIRIGFPAGLEITPGTTISVSADQPSGSVEMGFFPRDDYLLCEIYGSVPLYKSRKLVEEYIKKYKKPACLRGVGRGLQIAVTMSHLMKESLRLRKIYFDTFTGLKRDGKKVTGIQIVMVPD